MSLRGIVCVPLKQQLKENTLENTHMPDNVQMRLLHKYSLYLQNVFLSGKEQSRQRESIPEDVTTDTVISNSSKAAMRYLAGMCMAKAKFRNCQIAMNNVHKSSKYEQDIVRHARRRAFLLQHHIVPHSDINNHSTIPESLTMINRQQNLREGLTQDVFIFYIVRSGIGWSFRYDQPKGAQR